MSITLPAAGDNFNLNTGESAGILIASHLSTVDGAGWTQDYNGSAGTSNLTINPSGHLRNTGTDYGQGLHQITPSTNSYCVDVTYYQLTETSDYVLNSRARESVGVGGYRAYVSANNATQFAFQVNDISGGGTNTTLVSNINQTTTGYFIVRVQVNGNYWSGALLYYNGTNTIVIDRSPDQITSSLIIGNGGLIHKGTNSNTTGPAITNISINDTVPIPYTYVSNPTPSQLNFHWLQRRRFVNLSPSATGLRENTNIFSTIAPSGWTFSPYGGGLSAYSNGTFSYSGSGQTYATFQRNTPIITPTQTVSQTVISWSGGIGDTLYLGWAQLADPTSRINLIIDNHAQTWSMAILVAGTQTVVTQGTSIQFPAGTTFTICMNGCSAVAYKQAPTDLQPVQLSVFNFYTASGSLAAWNLADPNQLSLWSPMIITGQSAGVSVVLGNNSVCTVGFEGIGNPHVVRNLTGMPILKNNNQTGVYYIQSSVPATGVNTLSVMGIFTVDLTADPSYVNIVPTGVIIVKRNYDNTIVKFSDDGPGDLTYDGSTGNWHIIQGGWAGWAINPNVYPVTLWLGTTTTDPTVNTVILPLTQLNLPGYPSGGASTYSFYDPSLHKNASTGVITLNCTQTTTSPNWSSYSAQQFTATDSTLLNWTQSAGWNTSGSPNSGTSYEGSQVCRIGGQDCVLYVQDDAAYSLDLGLTGAKIVAFSITGTNLGALSGMGQPTDNLSPNVGTHPGLLAYPDPTDPLGVRTRYLMLGFDFTTFNILVHQSTVVNNNSEWSYPVTTTGTGAVVATGIGF